MSQNRPFQAISNEPANEDTDVVVQSIVLTDPGALQSHSTVVAVMGITGSGKSTFVSLLADQEVKIGHGLESDTAAITVYSFKHSSGKTVFLIDFPGFDDTARPDADLLKDISYFLATLYLKKCRLGGLVYLHRITDPRMGGRALKNLRLFQRLCGKAAFRDVCLVTTMWGELGQTDEDQSLGWKRHEELQQQEQFWGSMIQDGAMCTAHDGSTGSALNIISSLVERDNIVTLEIVDELVNKKLTLTQTEAGRFLHQDLLDAQKKFQRELAEYQDSLHEARRAHDEQSIVAIEQERTRACETSKKLEREFQGLNVGIGQLTTESKSRFQVSSQVLRPRYAQLESSREALAHERRIAELEESLRQQERKYQESLVSQKIQQQTQNLVQLQRMRQSMNQERQKHLQELETERARQHNVPERAPWSPLPIFLRLLFGPIVI